MRVKFTDGQHVGGIYRWYIDKFLNTQRGLSINTIWFLSLFPPVGMDLLEKSFNFINGEEFEMDGFNIAWQYMTDHFGDSKYVDAVRGLSENSIVFLLSKEVTIPGVSLDVNNQSYPATGGSGTIVPPTITSARKNNDHITIEMYLTDFSFPNVILRPWIRAISVHGMTERTLRGEIVFTQLTRRNVEDAGSGGHWQVSNVITLENAYPVSIPSYNMNYQGVDIDKTMSVEWGYDIIKVENKLGEIDKLRYKEPKVLDAKSWGASVESNGGEVEEPLEDTRRNWNEPNREYINLQKRKSDHGISSYIDYDKIVGEHVEEWDNPSEKNLKHWVTNGKESSSDYKVSVSVNENENDDTVMLNGWPFALHHYIPAFYNLFDFLTKQPTPEPKIAPDEQEDTPSLRRISKMGKMNESGNNSIITGDIAKKVNTEITTDDTPMHNGDGNIDESISSDDDSTITGDIAKKDDIQTPIDDTPYKYDSLGITKIGNVPQNDSNITGDISKKDNEKVKTPDTPGSRLTVPVIQENLPTNDHVNGRLEYNRNVNIPTDDSGRDGEIAQYKSLTDPSNSDSRNHGPGTGYKNIDIEPQGQISNGSLESYVPRGTTDGAGLGELYSEVETSENDVPLFAEVAKKIIIDSDSLSVNQ